MAAETIFALASAPGRAAVAVMRISGPRAGPILDRLCRRRPSPRRAALRTLRSPDGESIDQALVLWFPAPESFTGEDVAELQLHGGVAVVAALAEALLALGARPAAPGEFTRRAFEAGRLDLPQAEAVADLIDAETQAQRRQALSQLDGAITQRAAVWREVLIEALAFLEAQIDFPDEDIPADLMAHARAPLAGLLKDVEAVLADHRGERVRNGLSIVLIGPPNTGKSSLFNALVQRDAAIVTDVPGTTRDVIEATILIEGYRVTIADTAGLRDAPDVVEREGVRRALASAGGADLRVHVRDQQEPMVVEPLRAGDIVVLSKADLQVAHPSQTLSCDVTIIEASVIAAGGIDDLKAFLAHWVVSAMAGADTPAITQMRHRQIFSGVREHLIRALDQHAVDAELMAENLRLAARSLDQLAGRIYPDEVLHKVFGRFCIGK